MSCQPTITNNPSDNSDNNSETSIMLDQQSSNRDNSGGNGHQSSRPETSPTHLQHLSPTQCDGISNESHTMTPTADTRLQLDPKVQTVDTSAPQNCDKNKQNTDATSKPTPQDQQNVSPATRQMTSTTAEQSTTTTTTTITTKPTGLDEMNQKGASSETSSDQEFRVPLAKSSEIEEKSASPPNNRRARKASVFSHDGFLGIHQLDQSAIKQHSRQDLVKASQQEIQVNLVTSNNSNSNGSNKIEDLNTKLAGPTAATTSSSSPQRPTRSDTLGSTGSSRASSCDEPTIVSTPSSKNGSQQMIEVGGQLKRTSSSSTDSSLDSINNGSSLEDEVAKSDLRSPLKTMKNDDDVFSSTSKSNSAMVPAFQSIKTQLKRNSVPDAKFITQHIEKLISQNEAIIENWDQVSIRSYNSQANGSSQSSACTPTPITTTTTTTTTTTNTSSHQQANKRPSKRWSTTSLQTSCEPTESCKASLDHLVEARLRRRSQHTMKRSSMRPNLLHGASALLSSNFNNKSPMSASSSQFFAANKDDHQYQHSAQFLLGSPSVTSSANTTAGLSSSVPSSPKLCASSSAFFEIQKFLNGRLNIGAGATTTVEPITESSIGTHVSNPIQFSENIESAIKNLSLKRREEEKQQALIQQRLHLATSQRQQNLLMQSTLQQDDLIMAKMLSHYNIVQPQQQIFKDPISSESEIAAAILSHYQQRQAIEQLNLTQLAEYQQLQQQQQQQQLLNAAALHRQQQIHQSPVSGESNGPGSALERQPRDSQVLNEFLARMMLGRDPQPLKPPASEPAQMVHGQSHPIVMHNNQQQQASEMFTQPLDSASPAHRCNACDIPFWTRDLLNYHLMTSCSARTGPQSNQPIAFNFGQPNGFDRASNLNSTDHSLLMPPNAAQLASEAAPSLISKSTSPPTWRTTHNASSQMATAIDGGLDCTIEQESRKRMSYAGQVLVPPKSPHKSRESAELAWQQRLKELCILKQQLLGTTSNTNEQLGPQAAASSSNSNQTQESNLPIKKRKISEPNMRH